MDLSTCASKQEQRARAHKPVCKEVFKCKRDCWEASLIFLMLVLLGGRYGGSVTTDAYSKQYLYVSASYTKNFRHLLGLVNWLKTLAMLFAQWRKTVFWHEQLHMNHIYKCRENHTSTICPLYLRITFLRSPGNKSKSRIQSQEGNEYFWDCEAVNQSFISIFSAFH